MLDLSNPKIVASITSELESNTSRAVESDADIVEVRMDLYDGDAVVALGDSNPELPVIATNRHQEEGGEPHGTEEERIRGLRSALKLESVDAVDIEDRVEDETIKSIVEQAETLNKSVIISHHDFEETPHRDEIQGFLERARDLGGIPKIAVMPRSPIDVLDLLRVTYEYQGEMCAISMGEMGSYSRVVAPLLGSRLTYGSLGEKTAPGQLTVQELRETIQLLS